MPTQSSSRDDLSELIKKLKYEKLFIANERKEIEVLNRKVQHLCTELLQQSWLTGQHRLTLENLSRGQLPCPFLNEYVGQGSSGDGSRDSSSGGDNNEELELIEAQKHISPKYYQSYVDLLTLLRTHPDIVGLCITTYEKEKQNLVYSFSESEISGVSTGQILQAIINVYGGIGGPLPGDCTLHLKLLSVLAGMQIVGSENPRRILRQGSCAFSTLYRLISETIPSSRLFLVGSLHQPVTQLLSSPELLSLLNNISPTTPLSIEVSASFAGSMSSNKDMVSLDRTEKMAELTKLFITSILENIHAFPSGLAWLIKSIHSVLSQSLTQKEVNTICIDLIWALFICPAVTNPEPFGVTDAPVSTQARQTLSQVATLLQCLALYPWEGNDPRMSEYISYFDTASLSSVLDHVLCMEGLPVEESSAITTVSSLFRRTIFLPENQFQPLFLWLKECLVLLERNGKLTDIEIWPALVKLSSSVNDSISQQFSIPNSGISGTRTPPNNNSLTPSGSATNLSGSPTHRPMTLLSGGRSGSLLGRRDTKSTSSTPGSTSSQPPMEIQKPVSIIVVPITQHGWEWVGMLPECEVTATALKNSKLTNGLLCQMGDGDSFVGDEQELDEREDRSSIGEKRTRFSISQDDASIATSDILEAVSEAASTHSVSSSIEMEDQNDNLSDMLSANVSGRGTPNVSGRNSPISQAGDEPEGDVVDGNPDHEVEDQEMENDEDEAMNEIENIENEPPRNVPMNPPNLNNLNINGPRANPSKQVRSEIDDKFCKFEIKKLFGGDETVSLVSDTWSTDVLASDSEMGGDRLLLPVDPNVNQTSSRASIDASGGGETMSEAWSTDVAASDIERLHDFDTEETASVARSDRSEMEAAAYDTPRSSVSGNNVGRQQIDLLLFGDLPIQNSSNVNENSSSSNDPTTMELCDGPSTISRPVVNISPAKFQPGNPFASVSHCSEILLPEIIGPSQFPNQSPGQSSLLQAPGTSRPGPSSKTITFDKTAERGDREGYDDEGRTRKFFRGFKIFRGKGRKSRNSEDRPDWEGRVSDSIPIPKMRKNVEGESAVNESSDDILAKYRRKPSLTDPFSSPLIPSTSPKIGNGSVTPLSLPRKDSIKYTKAEIAVEARRKLRAVLSNCDLQLIQDRNLSRQQGGIDVGLTNILRMEISSAISRADQVTAAQLQEAVRTVQQLGLEGCKKVFRQLRDDYRRRSDFVSYLIRAKQGLLSTINFLEKSSERTKHEGETYTHYLITEWARLKLEEPDQEANVDKFILEFRDQRKTADEKTVLLESFLSTLLSAFIGNRDLSYWQISKLEKSLEQHIVAKVYLHALYPNREADMDRDKVLTEHISKLSNVISPSHKYLRIPKSQLGECPWPPAQRELKMLSAYKTACDKLRCVVRASLLILNLLSTSSEKAIAADDFVPVLVFVIIKSNPPAILSTIEYVNSFYGQKISGEDQYWWTQFCSAVEFIKTMEYTE